MLRRVACFALAASVIGACALPTDTGEDTGSASQAYMQYNMGFYNPFLNKCLDAYAWETSEFPRVAMWDCNGLGNQLWTYNTDTHEITDWNGNCLENWYFDNYSVGLHSCWGGSNQKWTIDYNRHELINDRDGKCLRSTWLTNTPCTGTRCMQTAMFLAGCGDSEWERYSVFLAGVQAR